MRNERGFSLIEIIVVMVIIAILMAAVVPRFLGAKAATAKKETTAAGLAYNSAIAQFQADHGNVLPAAKAGSLDMLTLQGKAAGPKNLLKLPYVKNLPSGVAEGRVGVSMDGSNCATDATSNPGTAPALAPKALGWVSYCVKNNDVNSNAYYIRVNFRDNAASPWKQPCMYGTDAITRTMACK
jgi:prepilin-type N-terminal cleavage/methylation domain-containing protein